jgi:hypothetical protein
MGNIFNGTVHIDPSADGEIVATFTDPDYGPVHLCVTVGDGSVFVWGPDARTDNHRNYPEWVSYGRVFWSDRRPGFAPVGREYFYNWAKSIGATIYTK